MKRIFNNGVGGIALFLFVITAGPASAIDPPHNFTCGTCHTTHASLGSSGYNNICLSCHRPGSPIAGKKPFTIADIANPFNSYTAALPEKMYHTSHNWNGSDTVPAAGAQSPLDPLLNQTKTAGSLACTRCHNVHAAAGTTSKPLLRSLNDRDQMCLDCHRSRNTTDQTRGTHPVNFDYGNTASAKPLLFNNPPINANAANPTSAVKLTGGLVLCTTCHGVHYTDSNSATFDNHSGYYKLTPSEGYLLRTDLHGTTGTSISLCTNCHIKANHHGTAKQQNVQCADCHGGHVDTGDGSVPNVYLIRRFVNVTTQYGAVRNRTVLFQSVAKKNYVDSSGTGICQACHPVPAPGGIYPPEHASTDAAVCNACHSHNTASSFSGGGCNTCHGFPPVSGVSGGPNGFAGNYATVSGVSEATTPHRRHAGEGNDYSYACDTCHKGNTHNSGTYQDVFLAPAGTVAADGGASPTYSASTRTCANVYCHSDGAPRNASLTPVFTARPIPGWVGGAGKITGCAACHDASPTTNAHRAHIAKGFGCVVCHAATVSDNTTISNRAKHADGVKTVSFAAGTLAAGTGWNAGTAGCTASRCHSGDGKGSAPVTPPTWTSPASGKCGSCHPVSAAVAGAGAPTIQTAGHATHLVAAYGPVAWLGTAASACQTCHVYASTQPDPRHVNGSVDVITGAGSACSSCHPGTLPAWIAGTRLACTDCHAAAPSTLPNGVAAPYKGSFSSTGHGQYAASNQCTLCHDANSAHISGTLGDAARLYGANDNTVCSGCHNGTTARTMATHVLDRNATPTPGFCKSCHDVHGTTNLHMIRTSISGKTIAFTNTSSGFVKTSRLTTGSARSATRLPPTGVPAPLPTAIPRKTASPVTTMQVRTLSPPSAAGAATAAMAIRRRRRDLPGRPATTPVPACRAIPEAPERISLRPT